VRREPAVAARRRTVSQFLFSPGTFFLPKTTYFPSRTLLFSISLIKDKLKGRHFDTIEVVEAELQAALNNLTQHDFQDAFKK
jgi:hypothetical protein